MVIGFPLRGIRILRHICPRSHVEGVAIGEYHTLRFPDRPAMNALLGIVCALTVLALLTWPLLASQNFPAQSLSPAKSLTSNNPHGVYNVPSGQTTSVTAVFTTAAGTTQIVQQTTVESTTSNSIVYGVPASSQLSNNASAGGSQSGTLQSSSSIAQSFSSTAGNVPTTTSLASISSQVNSSASTTVVVTDTAVQLQETTVISAPSQTLTTTTSLNQIASYGTSSALSGGLLNTLALLSVVALAIAAGSMFFIYRRVNSESS